MHEDNSLQEFQALLDAAVDGIVVIDHGGTIRNFNRSAEQLFGYSAAEAIGSNVSMLMTAEDRDAHDGHIRRYLADRVAHIVGIGREVNARRRDGTEFPAFLSVGVIAGSEPPRFVGIVRDISARRQADAQNHLLQDRLMHVSRLATIGEMASGIAHEINQPLAAMATYAQACDRLLDAPDPDIGEVQAALKQISDQAVRAGDIIRRMRALARTGEMRRSPTDLNSVIDELTDLIGSDARAHGVQYRLELAPDLPEVIADRTQIQHVVLNLVRNALEALVIAPPQAAQLLISTRRTADGDAEIAVQDNGSGVDPRVRERIFEPFCSTKPTGTGLGLPISRNIVNMHGGTLELQPLASQGARFLVRLPSCPGDGA
ncbi:MAG TPA: PAS domain S-box protein [Steroidobacteraceae bacterium]|nr:PAS domain S-box protein [Steroidobacteraceae bacterium]